MEHSTNEISAKSLISLSPQSFRCFVDVEINITTAPYRVDFLLVCNPLCQISVRIVTSEFLAYFASLCFITGLQFTPNCLGLKTLWILFNVFRLVKTLPNKWQLNLHSIYRPATDTEEDKNHYQTDTVLLKLIFLFQCLTSMRNPLIDRSNLVWNRLKIFVNDSWKTLTSVYLSTT